MLTRFPYGLTFLFMVQGKTVKGRVLVIADGATSKLATQMGYCTEPPKGVCSRAFIEGGTHNVDFDGVTPGPSVTLWPASSKH